MWLSEKNTSTVRPLSFSMLDEIVAHQLLQNAPRVKHMRLLARSDKPVFPDGKCVPKDDRDCVLGDHCARLGGPATGTVAKQLNRAPRDVCSDRAVACVGLGHESPSRPLWSKATREAERALRTRRAAYPR